MSGTTGGDAREGSHGLDLPFEPNLAERALLGQVLAGDPVPPDAPVPPREKRGWAGRRVRPEVVVAILASPPERLPATGIHLRNLRIEGDLDLTWTCVDVPLTLDRCRVLGSIRVANAKLAALDLTGSYLAQGVAAPRVDVAGSLCLAGATIEGPLVVTDACVGAELSLVRARLRCRGAVAMEATGLEVGANVEADRMTAAGGVVLVQAEVSRNISLRRASVRARSGAALTLTGAKVGGKLDCSGARLRSTAGDAIDGQDLEAGDVLLDAVVEAKGDRVRRFEAEGGVDLFAAELTWLSCEGARLTNPGGAALVLAEAEVTGDVHLTASDEASTAAPLRFEAEGELTLIDAKIGGDLNLSGASIRNLTGYAVGGDGLEARRVWLRPWRSRTGDLVRFEALGNVSFASATIGGELDGSAARITNPSIGAALDLRGLTARAVRLGTRTTRSADPPFLRCELAGGLSISGAVIEGVLDCTGARLDGRRDFALRGDDVKAREVRLLAQSRRIGNEVRFARFEAMGGVHLAGARAAFLSLRGAQVTGAVRRGVRGSAVVLSNAVVAGRVQLDTALMRGIAERFEALGEVRLRGARIDGVLSLDGAVLTATRGWAFAAEGLKAREVRAEPRDALVGGRAEVIRFECRGGMLMDDAEIGRLVFVGARLDGLGGPALRAEAATIGTGMWLTAASDAAGNPVPFEATGEVNLAAASLGLQLGLRGARLRNPAGPALSMFAAKVAGTVVADPALWVDGDPMRTTNGAALRFEATGGVDLRSASVGELALHGARVTTDHGVALDCTNLKVGGDALLVNAVDGAEQPVRDPSPEGASPAAEAPVVTFEAQGGVSFRGATIDGELNMTGARLGPVTTSDGSDGGGGGLDATGAEIKRTLYWRQVECHGPVNLSRATVSALHDDRASWTGAAVCGEELRLDGLAYSAARAEPVDQPWWRGRRATEDWRWRRDVLKRQTEFATQPYQELATSYRRAGDERSGRKIAMARFNAQLGARDLLRAPLAWAGRWILRAVIGHGYAPWRALFFVLALWAAGWYLIERAVDAKAMVPKQQRAPKIAHDKPTDCDQREYPCLEPAVYAADLLIPVVNLGQRDNWRPASEKRYRIIPAALGALGWLLTTLIVAGFTGLVRRE